MDEKKIIIVEDEAVIAMLIEQTLQLNGYKVCAVVDTGVDAIESTAQFRPDMILMDINIKGDMRGTQAAKIIHNSMNVPIIFLTAHSDPETRSQALESSPFGYVLKPFKPDSLISAMETAFYKSEMEVKLRTSESKLRAVFNSAQLGIVLIDDHLIIQEINDAALRMIGCGRDEAKYFGLLNHDKEQLWKLLKECDQPHDVQLTRKDGLKFWCTLEAHQVDGQLNLRTLILKDINQTIMLRNQLNIVQQAVEATKLGIVVSNPDGEILYINPAEANMHGYRVDELLGMKVNMLAPFQCHSKKAVKSLNSFERETINIRKDGAIFPVRLVSNVVESQNGEPSATVTVCEDISVQKELEDQIKKSQQRLENLSAEYRSILDGIQDSICLVSPDFQIMWANAASKKGRAQN